MEAGNIIRVAMAVTGFAVMLCSFWFLAAKRMTADFAVVWEIIGVVLIIAGNVSWLMDWTKNLYGMFVWPVIYIGMTGIFLCYFFSLLLSRVIMKKHELSIEVSMLLHGTNEADHGSPKDLLIILPVKNEERNIGKVLEQLLRPGIVEIADILCINDASTDDTGEIIDNYGCMQIKNVFELGYGSALQLGYKYAVRRNYQYVIQMDADGQHDPCSIPLIYRSLKEKGMNGERPDIVLASRFMKDSSEFSVSVFKKIAFGLFQFMILAVTGRKIADPTTGFQGLSRRAFTYYSGYNNFDYKYPDANMVMQMLLLGFQLTEVPAVMHVRTNGKSMHSGLEPAWYMPRMFLSVLAVVFRVKVLNLG